MEHRIIYKQEPDPRTALEDMVEEHRISVKELCAYINDFLDFSQLRDFNDHVKSELGIDDEEEEDGED